MRLFLYFLLSLFPFSVIAEGCGNINPNLVSSSSGACEINEVHPYYMGDAISVSDPEGTKVGDVMLRYKFTCLLPYDSIGHNDNYMQLGLDVRKDVSAGDKIRTTLDQRIFMKADLQKLAGQYGYIIPSIIAAPEEHGGGAGATKIRAKEVVINGKKYWCGHDQNDKVILSAYRGVGVIEPGENRLSTYSKADFVMGHFTGSGSTKPIGQSLGDFMITIGNATCKFRNSNGDITVNINNGAPMSSDEFDKIATNFDVPLECSSVQMDVKYKIKIQNDVGRAAEGIFGLTPAVDGASGVGYKLSRVENGAVTKAMDLSRSLHIERKGPDMRAYDLSFSVSPIKLGNNVVPGNADATLLLELDYD
ncbi:fimbrial protein [Aeromonas hydrophila]|uniref:fimbrial protein n=1 Tax=Aeromonas hydrophila TaxID=644 RepID=UPI001C5AFA1E|nr:fimbrial protein [Aeromonas hydrophila]MBW3812451.1 fimbrial protein [Aeromonas hydrophila]